MFLGSFNIFEMSNHSKDLNNLVSENEPLELGVTNV